MSGTTLLAIDARPRPAWPVVVDERDMDKLHQISERELRLLEQIHETHVKYGNVNAAILERLEANDADKEDRLRKLESVWHMAKGGAVVTVGLGVVAKLITLFWSWGAK